MTPDREFAAEFDLGDQEQQRLTKLRALREAGIDPYPPRSRRTHTATDAIATFEDWEAQHKEPAGEGQEAPEPPHVVVVGRLRLRRPGGKVTFAHLEDESGRVQLFFRVNDLQEPPWDYEAVNRLLDLGDFIQAEGFMFRTRAGEVTLHVQNYHLLAKSLHPLPEKYHGLSDVETRYRQRYLDLIANEEVRETFRMRSRLVSHMRSYLDARGFLEVETPVLQPIYGGATARPFRTHYEALDATFYLRIADELSLKRCIVGGLERVYEIGHDFRNEGLSRFHNPEFTMAEWYEAYADYEVMLELTEELLAGVVQEVFGGTALERHGATLSFARPFARRDFYTLVRDAAGVDLTRATEAELRAVLARREVADAD